MIFYKIIELNNYDQEIGIVNLDELETSRGMSFYWNKVLKKDDEIRTMTLSSVEAEYIYKKLVEKFPDKIFEIINE